MTSSGSAVVTLPADDQILITREFAAPKHLVFRAYTEPDLIARWWSGQRGKVTSIEVDLRVGGHYRYAMVANEGFEVAFNGEFREIVPDERIVCTEIYEGADPLPPGDEPLNIVDFTEADGRTTLTILMQMNSRELRDMILESGMESGLQEALDLMEQVAAELSASA